MRAFLCGLLVMGLGIGTARADKTVDWGPYLETPGQQHPIKNDSTPAIAAAAPTATPAATQAPKSSKTTKASRAKASKPAAEAKAKRPAPARKRHK